MAIAVRGLSVRRQYERPYWGDFSDGLGKYSIS